MSFNRESPSDKEIEHLFVTVPPARSRTFEFALVLGGTVSAGAYTAGAVDFLSEALDCFEEAKSKGDPRQHNVCLKVIAGTSGGGVNAAIAARALAYDFPPAVPANSGGINPYYETWVNRLRLDAFLKTDDVRGPLASLLNGNAIDDCAQWIQTYTGNRRNRPREWLGAPLTILLTLTNLCGIPYKLDFTGNLNQSYVDHADHIRFAVVYPGQSLPAIRPDEMALSFDDQPLEQATTWADFSLFARATAAFPMGFPPRLLTRPLNHYRYRVIARPGAPVPGATSYVVLQPDWDSMAGVQDDQCQLTAVDGGATDNEPIELARTALCGLFGPIAHQADNANRAVVLIDPFAGKAPVGALSIGNLNQVAGATMTALLQQTRYSTSDIWLALNENIYSRFMLTPSRDNGIVGSDAIASAGCGAFIGFACQKFMEHDYHLGRANCQKFLQTEFVLGKDNLIFNGWTESMKKTDLIEEKYLPIIPLCGAAAPPLRTPSWPKKEFDPETYRSAIEARFRAILQFEASTISLWPLLGQVGAYITQKRAANQIINAMKGYLSKANL